MSGRKRFDPELALSAAVRVFWERGYTATSIADLQQAMGLGRASLYSTFGGKEQLFLLALDSYLNTYGPPVREAFRIHHEDALGAIEAIFQAALSRMGDANLPRGCLAALSASEMGVLDPASHKVVEGLIKQQIKTIRSALAADVKAGRLRTDIDVDTLAVYVTGFIHSLSLMHRAGTRSETLSAVIDHATKGLRRTCSLPT